MQVLLDTCTFLWMITNAPEVSPLARRCFLGEDVQVYLSVVSVWEIVLKYRNKRLQLPLPPDILLPRECQLNDVEVLQLQAEATFQLLFLPDIHRDPFDRMLVCQAKFHQIPILTSDQQIKKYPVEVLW